MKKIMLCLGLAGCVFGGVGNYVIAMEKEEYKESSKTEGGFIDENQAKEIEKKLGKNFQLRKIERKSERGSKKYVDFFGSNRRVIGLYTSRGNDDDRFGTFLQLIASMLGLDRLCLMPNDEAVRPDKFLYSYENGDDGWRKSNNITNLMFLGLLSEVIAKGDEGSIEALMCFCGPYSVLWRAAFFSDSITSATCVYCEFGNAYNVLLKEMIWDNCNSYDFSIVKECLPIFLIQNLLYTDDIAYETLSSAVNKGIFAIPSKAGEEEKDPLSNTVNQLIRDKYGPLLDAVDRGNLDEVKKWLSGYILFGLIGSGNLEDVKFFMESVKDDNEFLKKTDDDEFLKKLVNIFNDEETTADNIIEAEFGSIEDEEIRAWKIENKRKIAIDVKLKNDLLRRAKQEFVNEILWRASDSEQYSEAARFLAGLGLCPNETVLKKLKKNKADIAARILFGGFCLGRISKIEDAIDKNLLLESGYHKKEIDAIKNGQLMDARIDFITDLFSNPVGRRLKKENHFLFAPYKLEKATRTFAREDFFTNVKEILIGCGVSRDSYLFEEMMKMARNRNLRQDFERSINKARKIAETMALNAQLVDVMIGSTAVIPDDIIDGIILDPLTAIKDYLAAGADVFLKNNDGKTAFDIAASCEYGEAPLLLLLNDIINKGLDLSPERIDTVLRNAVSFRYMDAVSLILDYVAERGITLSNSMVDMVLKEAESLGRTDVVDFIIDRGFLDNTNNPIYRALLERLRREQAQNRAKLKRERAQNQAALSREQAQNQAALRMISNMLQNMVRRMDNLQNSNL